jgi:pilus assembly protein CpaC
MQPTARHLLAVLTAAFALALPSAALAQQPAQGGRQNGGAPSGGEIGLAVGEQYSLPAGNIRSYSEGAPGIVDIRLPADNSRLLIVGQRPGGTTLLVIHNDGSQQTYAITVFRLPVEVVRQQVTQLLQGYTGVSINQIGGRLFLEGGVANEQQQRRVQQIAGIYQGQVESLVGVDPTIVERRINVRIDLYFVELSRTSNYMFGVAWPASYIGTTGSSLNANINLPFGAGASGLSGVFQGVINQPLPRLDMAATSGWARVHRQATVITANGNEAAYFNGGEVNIRTVGAAGAPGMSQIQYGSLLTITPRFDPSTSRVDLRVQADLSALADAPADQLPGRNISRVNTLVNLQLGQSMVLSGMRGRANTYSTTGIPGLSQIPILGVLFGSQNSRNQENEMVIFVVPTVIEGMSPQAEDRVANALRAYEDFGGLVGGNFPENPPLVPRPNNRSGASN